jgi:hypothetical protein
MRGLVLFLLSLVTAVLIVLRAIFTIPACDTEGDSTQFGAFVIRFLTTCDAWQAPHVVNPMFITILVVGKYWTDSAYPLLISGLFEALEVIGVVILSNYVIFIGVTNVGFENITDIILSDWIIQALLGITLGLWVKWFWRSPNLWYGWFSHRGHFMRWLGWFILFTVPQIAFAYRVGNTPDGFPLGAIITVSAQSIIFAFLVQNEPNRERIWNGRSEKERVNFWVTVYMIYTSFYLIVQFDWFFGSAPQTWVLWGIWMFYLGVWAAGINGRGVEILKLFDWSNQEK